MKKYLILIVLTGVFVLSAFSCRSTIRKQSEPSDTDNTRTICFLSVDEEMFSIPAETLDERIPEKWEALAAFLFQSTSHHNTVENRRSHLSYYLDVPDNVNAKKTIAFIQWLRIRMPISDVSLHLGYWNNHVCGFSPLRSYVPNATVRTDDRPFRFVDNLIVFGVGRKSEIERTYGGNRTFLDIFEYEKSKQMPTPASEDKLQFSLDDHASIGALKQAVLDALEKDIPIGSPAMLTYVCGDDDFFMWQQELFSTNESVIICKGSY